MVACIADAPIDRGTVLARIADEDVRFSSALAAHHKVDEGLGPSAFVHQRIMLPERVEPTKKISGVMPERLTDGMMKRRWFYGHEFHCAHECACTCAREDVGD